MQTALGTRHLARCRRHPFGPASRFLSLVGIIRKVSSGSTAPTIILVATTRCVKRWTGGSGWGTNAPSEEERFREPSQHAPVVCRLRAAATPRQLGQQRRMSGEGEFRGAHGVEERCDNVRDGSEVAHAGGGLPPAEALLLRLGRQQRLHSVALPLAEPCDTRTAAATSASLAPAHQAAATASTNEALLNMPSRQENAAAAGREEEERIEGGAGWRRTGG